MLHVEHTCEIPKEDDILFLPDRTPLRKLYDFLRLTLMASYRNPAARKYLGSTAFIVSERRRQLKKYMHIIHPFSMFSHCWNIVIIFVITIMEILIPYQAAFEMIQRPMAWTVVKNSLLGVCCIDMLIKMKTGYMDEEEHKVILDPKKILNRYIKSSTFFPDLLGSFPTDLFFITWWYRRKVFRKIASLICVFRVFSLSHHISKLAHAYDMPLARYEFCVVIYWLLIGVHWQSCLFWMIPIAAMSMQRPKPPANNSWVMEQELWHLSRGDQYFSSMLRAIATFMKSGLLQANETNMVDLYLIIGLQVLGILAPWILISRVMQFFKGTNSSRLKYQATMAQLRQYMRHKHLPHVTQARITEYYEFHFQRRYFRESEIIHTLSTQMRHEISMHSCRKLVENVTFFNNLPLSLLGRIVGQLKSEIFLTNDVIVRANQPGDCMYFIATGTVAIYTNSGKEVCHLEDGAHFGEVALVMPNELRVASVVAVEVCELYRLNRADFARTIHPYPMLWERIKKIAIERHEKTMILNAQ
ncbi:PREDICTED: potassium/sodium hyperpolarization-activated cyclic nucleotide-gated channel 1-like [Dufourea novaeangliae]|uniref:potassium/sodium hyperpolarization-activated cyclic nucleotide-gated channel 1-like n=1 Tax=Dufourea novaeangliae TaxID=178035 RepID=UPI000767319D|nr:PREDICTED: potassium/sodium hyperpolarization-activated cyclic nucleotide-gated channel 1-like [Dufourea novaeangliae]